MGKLIDKIKGKLMKAEGRATDDKIRQAQGWAVEKKGDAKDAIDRVTDKVDAKLEERERERTEPGTRRND